MIRIASLLIAALLVVACSNSDEAATTTTTGTVADSGSAAVTTEPSGLGSEATDTGQPGRDEPTTTEPSGEEPIPTESTEPIEGVEPLCSAYLDSITPSTVDAGLAELVSILGDDAPSGVLSALDTLQNPGDDVEAFFQARNSIDTYVLPVCQSIFRRGITPRPDNASAAGVFVAAVTDGDRAAAESVAPTNVIVQFDWEGYPLTTSDYNADNFTLTMELEPTVSVFCQLASGAIEFCAFSE